MRKQLKTRNAVRQKECHDRKIARGLVKRSFYLKPEQVELVKQYINSL